MKTLIAYFTKHGSTEKCAKKLKKKIVGDVDLLNLKNYRREDLKKYNKIIIGSPIYMGKIRKEVDNFINENNKLLNEKKIGFYICGMKEGSEAIKQLDESISEDLSSKVSVKSAFGGEFNFEKMNFLEKMVVKKVAGVKKTTSNIKESLIDELATKINKL